MGFNKYKQAGWINKSRLVLLGVVVLWDVAAREPHAGKTSVCGCVCREGQTRAAAANAANAGRSHDARRDRPARKDRAGAL